MKNMNKFDGIKAFWGFNELLKYFSQKCKITVTWKRLNTETTQHGNASKNRIIKLI